MARWDPPNVIRRVNLCLNAKVLGRISILGGGGAKVPFLVFLIQKGYGHIDMLMTFPW